MKPGTMLEAPAKARAISPLRDYLVIRPITRPGMIGGLYLPESPDFDNKNGLLAEVIAAGPECGPDEFWKVEVGDTVHVAAYGATAAGAKIKLGDETVILIRARDITGVVEE